MTTRWIIGVAPGTSLYGADAVLLQIAGTGLDLTVRLVHASRQPYPRDLRALLLRLGSGAPVEARQFALLHRLLGEALALAVRQVADKASFSLQQVLCVGCAGHCLWQETEGRYPSLLESGMAAVVAERTGLTTVSDFRTRDLASGGLGGPIEALADWLLFRHPRENRVLIHLGGSATVVFLPASARAQDVIGFEAGPCNLLLDSLVRRLTHGREACDPGGKYAVMGQCLDEVRQQWLSHPFWQRRPPKGLSCQVFGEDFVIQTVRQAEQQRWDRHDLLCTATHLVADGIGLAVRQLLPPGRRPDRVLLSGGGIKNGLLWQLLEQQLREAQVARTDDVGWPADYRRAVACGVLAALTVDGVPGNLPTATGAAGSRLLGSLTSGSPANWARCLAWMAAQAAFGYRAAA